MIFVQAGLARCQKIPQLTEGAATKGGEATRSLHLLAMVASRFTLPEDTIFDEDEFIRPSKAPRMQLISAVKPIEGMSMNKADGRIL